MKKIEIPPKAPAFIARVALVFCVLTFMFAKYSFAKKTDGPGILDKRVTLNVKNANFKTILKKIEQVAEITFSYTSNVVPDDEKISVTSNEEALRKVFLELFNPYQINFEVIGSQVILTRKRLSEKPPKEGALFVSSFDMVITGSVKDEDGSPIQGASVVVKGREIGTFTNKDGNYSIDVPENGVLVFSFVGYASQEIATDGKYTVDVTLVRDSKEMGEVVVTALGITKVKRGLVFSTSEVKGADFTEARETNIASALTGKIAGVDATQVASGPGGSSRVVIRGVGAINANANNQPLYVVNGSPIYNGNGGASANSTGFNYDTGDGISSINPDDIETITVLKSGAAAALYGSQAANGVILITTKSGRSQNGIGVELNSNYDRGTPATYPNYQYEYGSGNDGVKPATQTAALSAGRLSYGAKMDGSMVVQFDGVERPYSPVTVKDNINNFYRPSQNFTNTVAFYGGSHQLNFRLSASDLSAQAQTPNSKFDRKTTNLSINSNLGKNDLIVIKANAQYNFEKGRNRPNVGYAELNPSWATYLLGNTVDIRSLAPGYDANGDEIQWNPVPAAPNPWFIVNKIGNGDAKNRFIGSASVQVNLLKNLFVLGIISKDYDNIDRFNFVPIGDAFTPKGYYNSYTDQFIIDNSRFTVNYNTELFGALNVNAFVGGNRERHNSVSGSITGKEFIQPNVINYSNLSVLDPPYRFETALGINSVFASADLDYKRLVYISLTGRKDWFSTLNPGSNSIFYPSLGGSVILSDIVKLPSLISFLKLRGSWAQVGNASVDPYAIKQAYTFTAGGFNGVPVLNASNMLLDPDLRPLTVTTSEGGFEAQLFNGRLGLDFTYYDKKTTNNILRPDISNATGYLPGDMNAGTMRNRGVEILITGKPIVSQDFSWNVSYNMAWNQNEILSLAPGLTTISNGTGIAGTNGVEIISQVGLPYATLRGYVFQKDPKTGEQVYNAVSGYEARELRDLGVAIPPYVMGLTNEFRYKRFSVNFLIDAKFGAIGFSNLWQYAYRFGLAKETLPGRESGLTLSGVDQDGNPYTKTWTVDLLDTYYNNKGTNYSGDVNVFNTDFIKLRSAILSYRIPVEKLNFVKIQSASIAVVGRNLLILYRDKRVKAAGLDPEFQQTVSNVVGTTGTGEPVTRNIGLNLNIKF